MIITRVSRRGNRRQSASQFLLGIEWNISWWPSSGIQKWELEEHGINLQFYHEVLCITIALYWSQQQHKQTMLIIRNPQLITCFTLTHSSIPSPLPISTKFDWDTVIHICWHAIYGCFCMPATTLSNWNCDFITHKATILTARPLINGFSASWLVCRAGYVISSLIFIVNNTKVITTTKCWRSFWLSI